MNSDLYITGLLVIISFFPLVYYILFHVVNFPPGPIFFPLFGCWFQVRGLIKKLGSLHAAFSYLCEKYKSNIIGLKLGGELTVVVSGYTEVLNSITKTEFLGRTTDNSLHRLVPKKGITCNEGKNWREQRGFVEDYLKNLPLGWTTIELLIKEQIKKTMNLFATKEGQEFCPDISPSILSVLLKLTIGRDFSHDKRSLNKILDVLNKEKKILDKGIILPFSFNAPEVDPKLISFLMYAISKQKEIFLIDEEPRTLIDGYLQQINEDNNNNIDSTFNEEQLAMICFDLLNGGVQPTSTTLSFALIILARYKEIQDKIHAEIDENLTRKEFPITTDRKKLHYLQSFITEIYRRYPVTPVVGPRKVLTGRYLNRYFIPKDATILFDIWSANNDPTFWDNPEEFKADRFIKNGVYDDIERNIFTFGLGQRGCLGELLAKGFIFVFLATLLQKYEITTNDKKEFPNPISSGFTIYPPAYKIILKRRN